MRRVIGRLDKLLVPYIGTPPILGGSTYPFPFFCKLYALFFFYGRRSPKKWKTKVLFRWPLPTLFLKKHFVFHRREKINKNKSLRGPSSRLRSQHSLIMLESQPQTFFKYPPSFEDTHNISHLFLFVKYIGQRVCNYS